MVTHYFPSHGGGVEIVAGRVATGLAKRGMKVEWFAAAVDPPPSGDSVAVHPVTAWNGIEQRTGVPFPIWHPRSISALQRALWSADALVVHDSLYLPNLASIWLAKRAGKPVMLVQHVGDVPFRHWLPRTLVRVGNAIAARWALGSATRVVFISRVVQRWFLARQSGLAGRCEYLPNGVDGGLYSETLVNRREAERDRHALDDRPVFLFVGRFVEKKGITLLRQLARLNPDCLFAFAGRGPLDPGAGALGNVRVLGQLEALDLATWYAAADYLILPSVGEGFPLVVQEALASGLPALVGQETALGCPELGQALQGYPVTGTDADVDAWHAAVRACVVARPTVPFRIATARRAASLWSWERSLDRYADVIRSMTACATTTR